ncbi:MAG: hypothetical protein H0Z33_12270 [Bacillaceae bacterium]|nr:hypothetical protein [Bacillaceae bacterium]
MNPHIPSPIHNIVLFGQGQHIHKISRELNKRYDKVNDFNDSPALSTTNKRTVIIWSTDQKDFWKKTHHWKNKLAQLTPFLSPDCMIIIANAVPPGTGQRVQNFIRYLQGKMGWNRHAKVLFCPFDSFERMILGANDRPEADMIRKWLAEIGGQVLVTKRFEAEWIYQFSLNRNLWNQSDPLKKLAVTCHNLNLDVVEILRGLFMTRRTERERNDLSRMTESMPHRLTSEHSEWIWHQYAQFLQKHGRHFYPLRITIWGDIPHGINNIKSIRPPRSDQSRTIEITRINPSLCNIENQHQLSRSLKNAHLLLVGQNHPMFRYLPARIFSDSMRFPYVVDLCSLYEPREMRGNGVFYRSFARKKEHHVYPRL